MATEMNDEKIRQLAYRLWEEDGRPEGKEMDHWSRAAGLIEADSPGKTLAVPSGASDSKPANGSKKASAPRSKKAARKA